MKKIQFKIDHGRHKAGSVIGTPENQGQPLVDAGIAQWVGDDIRPLKYEVGAKIQSECVAPPPIEELEAAPKGAKIPPELLYETPELSIEDKEEKVVKAKKDKQKTNT